MAHSPVLNLKKPRPVKRRVKKASVFRSPWERVVTYTLIAIGLAVTCVFALWWFQPGHVPHNFSGLWHVLDLALFALLTFVVWYQVTNELLTWEVALAMKEPVPMPVTGGLTVALCTAFVPNKEPYDVLERTLVAMKRVRYPHDTWVLDEGNDPIVRAMCTRLGVRHFSRAGKRRFNTSTGRYTTRTKAGNYNAWFKTFAHYYDVVAQHDMDFKPLPQYLERVLGYFDDPDVAFVGTPQIYGNESESWIAKGASEQAYGFYGPMQKGLFGHDMHLFVGANHAIRVRAHDDIAGYSGHIVEDHLTGMRLYANRWKSVFVPEVLLVGEGPATWGAYFRQQMRWAYGLMDILFRHSPTILPRMRSKHQVHYLMLQHFYFYGLAQAIGLVLISLYFVFGIQSTTMELTSLLIIYPSFLIMQILIFLWLQRYYIDPARESGFHIRGKVLNIAAWPVYLIAFIGAMRGTKLNYEVTPKGGVRDAADAHPSLFLPHFVLGTVSLLGLIIGITNGNDAPQILFWAILNTLFMYGFVAVAAMPWLYRTLRERLHHTETAGAVA